MQTRFNSHSDFVISNPTHDRCEKIISFLEANNNIGFGLCDIAANLGYKKSRRAYYRIRYAVLLLQNKGILTRKGFLFRLAKDGKQVWNAFCNKNEQVRLNSARQLANELLALFA